jgi:hypothetical protein
MKKTFCSRGRNTQRFDSNGHKRTSKLNRRSARLLANCNNARSIFWFYLLA